VLALVSTPTFDPNRFADGIAFDDWRSISEDPRRPLHDRAIASFYAPGSTFKVLMAIAGLETGTITPEETVHCSGSTRIYGHPRLCWKRGGHGTVSLRRALAESCNVYFYHLGRRLGIDPIHDYGDRFNLGRPTGIDLPGEASGVLPSRHWKRERTREPWYPGDTISVSIGQGLLAVTPVQMAALVSAVANGGWLPRPHLGVAEPRLTRLDVSERTLALVRAAMRDAVEHGTGRRADLKGVPVAGKTGTAQVYKHSAGIDADLLPKEERDHAWFVGFAPADEPRIAFAVVIEHGGHGGSTAAPVVRHVLEQFFADPPPPLLREDDRRAGAEPDEESPDDRTAPAG
jgi:penicillin-binding protein 2